jgi:RNA polymerase sigma factor (sigma-70 family)
MNKVVDHLRMAVLAAGEVDLTDGQLLDAFVSRRDETAVAALVRRHGPMVWGVCRRILRNDHDAEDAFQATFLVLVRKATSIWPREMVGNWLYGVAHRTALKAKAMAAKRQAREKHVSDMPEPAAPARPDLWHELQPQLDQELSRLPDKYRIAIILCDLEGKVRKQVASQLQIPEGTLSSRLTTARTMLARRLAPHGLTVTGAALAVVLPQQAASAGLPTSVASFTIKVAGVLAAGKSAAGIASTHVVALTEGVLKPMHMTKLQIATAVLLAVSVVGLGSAAMTYGARPPEQDGATNAPAPPAGKGGEVVVKRAEIPKAGSAEQTKVEDEQEGPAGTNPKLRALLKERLDTLQKMADRVILLGKNGAASQGEVREANLRVYKAELDLCETTEERIGVLAKIARLHKETERQVSELHKRGAASQGEVLEATVSRLEAEIAVEREKAKLPAPPK